MPFRVAAAVSLVLSGVALLIAGVRTLAQVVAAVHPEVLPTVDGVDEAPLPYAQAILLIASGAVTLAWLAVLCLTATALALTDQGRAIAGRVLVAVAGLLLLLAPTDLVPGGLTESAAAAAAMTIGAWATHRQRVPA